MRTLPVRILLERSIVVGRRIFPGSIVFVDISVDLVHQGCPPGGGENALDSQIGCLAIGLSQIQQQGWIRGEKQTGLAHLLDRRLDSSFIPQRPGKPGMCLLIGWFQSHCFDKLWDCESRLSLLFVVDTEIEANAGQSALQLLGLGQGPG